MANGGSQNFKRAQVLDLENRGQKVFVEFGLLLDGEFEELVGKHAKPYVQETQLQNQHGSMQNVRIISLAGLSCGQIHAMRRIQIFCNCCMSMQEMVLEAEKQLHEGQAELVFAFSQDKLLKKLPNVLKSPTAQGIFTVQELMARDASQMASLIDLEAMPAAPVSRRAEAQAPITKKPGKNKRKASGDTPTAPSVSMFGAEVTDIAKRAASDGGKRSKGPKSDSQVGEAGLPAGSEGLPAELQRVVKGLGKVPDCFEGLSIEAVLSGKKIGCKLNGVSASAVLVGRSACC